MRVVTDGTLEGNMKLSAEQEFMKSLSKALEAGNTYRLFFPLGTTASGKKNIIAESDYGRNLDYDRLKVGYYSVEDMEKGADNRLHDTSIMQSYARMSRVLYDAEATYTAEKAKREAKEEAAALGTEVDEKTLAVTLDRIKLAYYGDNTVTPAIKPTKKRLIGSATVKTFTEAVVVKVDSNGVPDMNTVNVVSLELSKTKKEQINNIVNNKDYLIHDDILEIGYSYLGKDKQEAGRNATFQGISRDTSVMKCTELWPALEREIKSKLTYDKEVLYNRIPSLRKKVTKKEVISAFKTYISKQRILFAYVDYEDDNFKWAAKDFLEEGIGTESPKFTAEVQREVEAQKEEETKAGIVNESVSEDINITEEQLQQVKNATNLEELSEVDGIDELLGDNLEEID